ncbi:hypothetical protein [Mesorhizobium sp. 10J20-29]
MAAEPIALLKQRTGDWWQDERRHWCAYCGIKMRQSSGHATAPTGATEDHVIPLAHNGGSVTIPSCRACNHAKASMSLPQFLVSDYFQKVRGNRHRNQWSLKDLWLVMALAAVERAKKLADTWPDLSEDSSIPKKRAVEKTKRVPQPDTSG